MIAWTARLVVLMCFLPTLSWAGPLPTEKEQKLLELESQVTALEQKAFELRQKLKQINDKIFKKKFDQGKPKVSIYHVNKMAGFFHIIDLKYTLSEDKAAKGKSLLSKQTTVQKRIPNQLRIYQGNIKPGAYVLKVTATIKGYNPVLTYVNNYKITLRNSLPFRASRGKTSIIRTEFQDLGGNKVSKRLRIIFRVTR